MRMPTLEYLRSFSERLSSLATVVDQAVQALEDGDEETAKELVGHFEEYVDNLSQFVELEA